MKTGQVYTFGRSGGSKPAPCTSKIYLDININTFSLRSNLNLKLRH